MLQQNLANAGRLRLFCLFSVLLLTAVTFAGTLQLEWTNWDDNFYVYENPMVANADFKGIFTSTIIGNYNPLPIATFAVEWQMVGENPWLFHFDNLWMHLVCTALVFWLMGRLGLKPLWAGFAALLFGIHPMHVESVAWITERKDVLYGMFYLGSLLTYLRFRENRAAGWYLLCLLLFVLALLSKIQAVTLPLTMVLMDAFLDRKWPLKDWLAKVPFFVGALAFGLMGIVALGGMEGFNAQADVAPWERLVLGLNTFSVYVLKAAIPYETCLVYPYPRHLEFQHVLGAVMALVLGMAAFLMRRRWVEWSFGLVFFALHVVFLLQIVGAGHAYQADRFTYLAYFGLFFAMAMAVQRIVADQRSRILVAVLVLGLMNLGFAIRSIQYIPKWENSLTIWSDMIRKYPRRFALAYINRGEYLKTAQMEDSGWTDFNTAIELQPDYYLAYLHRGDLGFLRGLDAQAIADYTMVLKLAGPYGENELFNDALTQAQGNRGSLFVRTGRPQEGLIDLNLALGQKPQNLDFLFSRALAYGDLGNLPMAIQDFSSLLDLEPNSVPALINRAVAYLNTGQTENAERDLDRALQLDPGNESALANLSLLENRK